MEPIAAPLLQWFNANKRLLPFRQEFFYRFFLRIVISFYISVNAVCHCRYHKQSRYTEHVIAFMRRKEIRSCRPAYSECNDTQYHRAEIPQKILFHFIQIFTNK